MEPLLDKHEFTNALEALIFASPEPLSEAALRKVLTRFWAAEAEADRIAGLEALPQALLALQERWSHSARGFTLVEVAEGFAFRTAPVHGAIVRALREERPQRLSKPALETLAIVAYRQPVTKPEVDTIRGVDCGGTVKVLLDRNLVRIVGKKEEPGRPLLYGTTKDFLNLFCMAKLTELPSLREFAELNDDNAQQVQALGPSLEEISATAKPFGRGEEPAVADLHEAVKTLDDTECCARDALAEQGIVLPSEQGTEVALTPDAPHSA